MFPCLDYFKKLSKDDMINFFEEYADYELSCTLASDNTWQSIGEDEVNWMFHKHTEKEEVWSELLKAHERHLKKLILEKLSNEQIRELLSEEHKKDWDQVIKLKTVMNI